LILQGVVSTLFAIKSGFSTTILCNALLTLFGPVKSFELSFGSDVLK